MAGAALPSCHTGGYQLPEIESDALVMGTALVLQRLLANPSDSSSSGHSAEAAAVGAGMSRGWQPWRRARQLPNKPLTFVCTLHDPQNRSVLQVRRVGGRWEAARKGRDVS